MDQKLTDEERDKIYDDLADTMIDALGKGFISDEEAPNSSKYILEALDNVKIQSELDKFFQDLCNRWKIYKPVYDKFKAKLMKKTDELKMNEITSKLNQLIQN